ncbi:MAG: DHH family phosphoesterase, partial [Planctomycetota bacterium]
RPDCDALGSELGMAEVLRGIGKDVQIVNAHACPPNLAFIDPDGQLHTLGTDVTADQIAPDCLMVLDTSAWAQLGDMGDVIRALDCEKMIVDHHVGEDDLGATMHKDTSAEATGHLVIQAADALGVAINKRMADACYAAIATDTGWYRFGSVTPATYRVAARLLEAGAVPQEIYSELYERDTLGRLLLRGRILAGTESEMDGALVHTRVTRADFDATGALPTDTEDAINLTLAIAGTQAAVIMIEQPSGGFKLSFRSRCAMNCNDVAANFGGGGHKAAAGAFLNGTLQEVQDQVLPIVRKSLQEALNG